MTDFSFYIAIVAAFLLGIKLGRYIERRNYVPRVVMPEGTVCGTSVMFPPKFHQQDDK